MLVRDEAAPVVGKAAGLQDKVGDGRGSYGDEDTFQGDHLLAAVLLDLEAGHQFVADDGVDLRDRIDSTFGLDVSRIMTA